MTKKLTYQGAFKSSLLSDQLLAALVWSPVTNEGTARLESKPDGSEVYIYADDNTDEQAVQAIVDVHDPDELTTGELIQQAVDDSIEGFKTIPDWATWTPNEAEQHIQENVINGFDQTQLDAWIDTNVTNLAEAKDALKLIGGAIIDLRNIVSKIAKMIMWLRNIIIKVR
jgi:hypothetical protein